MPEPGKEKEVILGLDTRLRILYTGVFVPAHDLKLRNELVRYYRVPAHSRKLHMLDCKLQELKRVFEELKATAPPHHWNSRKRKVVHALCITHKAWLSVRKEAENILSGKILADCFAWRQAGWDIRIAVGYLKHINERIPHVAKNSEEGSAACGISDDGRYLSKSLRLLALKSYRWMSSTPLAPVPAVVYVNSAGSESRAPCESMAGCFGMMAGLNAFSAGSWPMLT